MYCTACSSDKSSKRKRVWKHEHLGDQRSPDCADALTLDLLMDVDKRSADPFASILTVFCYQDLVEKPV
jgi:hypothetical protein